MVEAISSAQQVEEQGFSIIEDAIRSDVVEALRSSLAAANVVVTRSRGVRNLASKVPEIAALAMSPDIRGLAESVIGSPAILVRSILFDKVEGANWAIRWHQDKTIAVRERIDVPGYGPWSTKEGVVSVQPPSSVLERMVSIRIHLDDCGEDNGALKVIPGSHRVGKLSAAEQSIRVRRGPHHVCATPAGGALLMKPLLLHASSPSSNPSHRRVVHLDYSAETLEGGLEWSPNA